MAHAVRSRLAALLVVAVLVLPGTALAAPDIAPMPEVAPLPDVKDAPDPRPVPKLAEVKVSREDAIAMAQKTFPIPAGMNEPNASLSQYRENAVWRLEWMTPSKEPNRRSVSVEVDAQTGEVLRYSTSSASAETAELSYSRSEAFKVAAQWLDKLAGARKAGLRFVDDPLEYGFYSGNLSFRFHWDRMEGGYPVSGDGIDISVDARTGELAGYSVNWRSAIKFTRPESLLTREQAEDLYRGLPLQLQYSYYQKPGTEQGEWRLVYRPYGGFTWLTQQGRSVDWSGKPIDFDKLRDSQVLTAGKDVPAYTKPEKPLDAAAALALARKLTGREDEPSNIDCQEYGEEQKTRACYMSWEPNDEKDGGMSVQIDLTTGLPMHYSHWTRWESSAEKLEPAFTLQQAREIAVAFMQQVRPDLAGKAVVLPSSENRYGPEMVRSYNVGFQQLVNSIPVNGWNSSVEVDSMTGEVRYYWSNTNRQNQKEPFPAVADLLMQSAAMEGYLVNKGIELTWVTWPGSKEVKLMDPMAMPAREGDPETHLVWAPRQIMPAEAIDAKTGALYDYQGRDLVEAAKRPADIEGHFAQREIELLWARGIFELKDGKFNPNETISAAELSRWLVLAKGMQPYYEYAFDAGFGGRGAVAGNMAKSEAAPYLGAALNAGILLPEDFSDDYDPATPATREVYALWSVRALGFGDIAKMENRIDMPFADRNAIDAKYQNAVALLHGLKIIRGDATANFAPDRLITRGEAAKILFSVASKGRTLPFYK